MYPLFCHLLLFCVLAGTVTILRLHTAPPPPIYPQVIHKLYMSYPQVYPQPVHKLYISYPQVIHATWCLCWHGYCMGQVCVCMWIPIDPTMLAQVLHVNIVGMIIATRARVIEGSIWYSYNEYALYSLHYIH